MSVELMRWVFRYADTRNVAEQMVLIAISDNAADDGTNSYPSIGTLARKCRLTGRAVQLVIARLKSRGVIEIEKAPSKWGTNRFVVRFPQGGGVNDVHPPPERRSPDPSLNHPDQDQDHRATARASHRVLVKLAHQAKAGAGDDPVEMKELLKELAARAGIPYDSGAIHRALGAVLYTKGKR